MGSAMQGHNHKRQHGDSNQPFADPSASYQRGVFTETRTDSLYLPSVPPSRTL
jgi:hypothetical protein